MWWSDDAEQTHVWVGGREGGGSRVKSVCLHEWIGGGGSRVARRERVGGERSECAAHVTVDRARGYFGERPKDVAIWSRGGGWLQTPDGGVAVRHGLVRWVHTSLKTSSTGYRLTATAIPFPSPQSFLPLSLSFARSKYNSADYEITRSRSSDRRRSSHGAPTPNDIDVRISKSSSFRSHFGRECVRVQSRVFRIKYTRVV